MLQVIQYQKTGTLSIQELPAPQLETGRILVRNSASLISVGTERMSVETAQASLIGKARSRPDLVKQVIENAKREGSWATYRKVKNRLDNYKELGYSSAGTVIASAVPEFVPGDRVACAGTAHHAEIVSIPKHLAVKIPDNVGFDEAAFTTLGAIAMQGVRQANVRIGETVAVIGLGLLGLITIQLLKANGCRVVGLDVVDSHFDVARRFGCDLCARSRQDAVQTVASFTRGYGTDAVIVTAGTSSNEPVELACKFSRKRGTIVIVGAVGMDVPRSPFYEKELVLTIACSYGPGRYDATYEYQGIDYPLGYVRWTENRNMEAVVNLISQRCLDMRSLITHRYPIKKALDAYDLITGKKKAKYIGILIEYPASASGAETSCQPERIITMDTAHIQVAVAGPIVSFIGAGNFAQSSLLPPLQKLGVPLRGVAVLTPVDARSVAAKFGFAFCTTDPEEVLQDSATNTVFIATHHDSHASYVMRALTHDKHVFVEKPLAVGRDELIEIAEKYATFGEAKPAIMTGFNRRFSRPFRDIREFFRDANGPFVITYRVNAGVLPLNHWLYEPGQGGRIVGEACHFIDCMTYLTNASPVRVFAETLTTAQPPKGAHENVSVTVKFSDGSIGHLLYFTTGDPSAGKELCEISGGNATALMNNFKEVILWRSGKRSRTTYDGRKGHREEVQHFIDVVSGTSKPLLTFESMYRTSMATLAIGESIMRGKAIQL